jgi:tetratricopeptide (TPR) repeat protein
MQINVIPPAWPNPAKDTKIRKYPMPQEKHDWHQAMRDFLKVDPKKTKVVPYKFAIAYTYYQYGHVEKAKKALWEFLKDHCDTPQGFDATRALLTMALIKNKGAGGTTASLAVLKEVSLKLGKARCGTKVTFPPKTPKKTMAEYAKKVKKYYEKELKVLDAEISMNRADALYKEARRAKKGPERDKKYLQAAKELEAIARRNPDSPRAAISLYYAAEGYEETKRFRKAKKLYEEIIKNPKWRKQIKKVKEESCTTVGGKERCKTEVTNKLDNVTNFLARAAWKAMEFKEAMNYYGQLALGKVEIDEPELRVNAYFWYARLLRIHGRPREAVRYFLKYYQDIGGVISKVKRKISRTRDKKEKKQLRAELTEAERFKVEVFYQIGTIYKRLNDLSGMERYYGKYIDQVKSRMARLGIKSEAFFEKKANKNHKTAAYQMMDCLQTLKKAYWARKRKRRKVYAIENDIIATFNRFHLPTGSNAASYAAAIAFKRIQPQFQRFMKRKLTLKRIKLRAKFGKKNKQVIAMMCELMGWGVQRGKSCAPGKAFPMLKSVVNPYVKEVNNLTDKFLKEVAAKYQSAEWNLAIRARMGQMYAKAAQYLEALPLPPEVKKFWKIFWVFVQKYKANPRMRTAFEQLLSQYEIDIDDEELEMEEILENYKRKLYVILRKNAKMLREKAIEHYTKGVRDARNWGISNEWTTLMRKGLTALAPDRFPFVHNAKVAKD